MQALSSMVIWPRCSWPRSTRAFSRLAALPMLTPLPTCNKSWARKVMLPMTASWPMLAPERAEPPDIEWRAAQHIDWCALNQPVGAPPAKIGQAPQRVAAGFQTAGDQPFCLQWPKQS